MQPHRSLLMLLSTIAVVLLGVTIYLLLRNTERNIPFENTETSRYETVFGPSTNADLETNLPVSQDSGEAVTSFGTDAGMEFPVIEDQ